MPTAPGKVSRIRERLRLTAVNTGGSTACLLVEPDACDRLQTEDRPLPLRPQEEVRRLGCGRVNLVAHFFQDGRRALRGEYARDRDIPLAHADAPCRVNRVEQGLLVLAAYDLPESPKRPRSPSRGPRLRRALRRVTIRAKRVCWASNSSDSTCNVFVKVSQTIWLIPTTLPVSSLLSAERAAETDQKHGFTRDGVRINRAVERNRNACLEVEPIQRVDHVEIFAVGDVESCNQGRAGSHGVRCCAPRSANGEDIRWERPGVRMIEIEERADGMARSVARHIVG